MSNRINDGNDQTAPPRRRRERRCPICGEPAEVRWRPFCSKRCADIDLGRWLGEAYRIPAEDGPGDADDENVPPSEA